MSSVPASSPAPIAQRENTKLGMWIFLGGEVVFFVTLILTFTFVRVTQGNYEAEFRSYLSIPLIGINTFILVTSSFLVVRALEAIGYRGDQKRMRYYLLAVIVLGLIFLGGQAFEWSILFGDGIDYSSTYGSPFYTVTGIHATHVFIGVVWAIYLLLSHHRHPYTKEHHLGIENFGLYWHFVDIVWIVLFTVIYLV